MEANSWMKESILVELIRIILHCCLKWLYSVCFDLIVLVPVKISAACLFGCVGIGLEGRGQDLDDVTNIVSASPQCHDVLGDWIRLPED